MKWITTAAGSALLLILLSLTARTQPEVVQTESIAAVVNNDAIPHSTLDAASRVNQLFQVLLTQFPWFGQVLYSSPEGEALLRIYRLDILEQLIDTRLLVQQAEAHSIEVDPTIVDEQVNAYLSRVMAQNAITMEQLTDVLEQQGSSLEVYKENLTTSYREQEQIKLLYEEITQPVEVDDQAIAAYYEEHKDDLAREDGSIPPFEEVEDEIRETLLPEAQSDAWKTWFNRVKKEANIQIFL
jgi:parvulin-like peptidyl-prolyl isomerase